MLISEKQKLYQIPKHFALAVEASTHWQNPTGHCDLGNKRQALLEEKIPERISI